MGKNLCYTIAFDAPGCGGTRQLAKLLVSSLLRTYFSGDIIAFRNSLEPLFLVERAGLQEIYIETPNLEGGGLAEFAMRWKALARKFINAGNYDWILFLDADCLVLRNIDHLIPSDGLEGRDGGLLTAGEVMLLYQKEHGRSAELECFSGYYTEEQFARLKRSKKVWEQNNARSSSGCMGNQHRTYCSVAGVNSGTWAVRGQDFEHIMRRWDELQDGNPLRATNWREQSAWNRIIEDSRIQGNHIQRHSVLWGAVDRHIQSREFESGEIQFPLLIETDWRSYSEAAIIHATGGSPEQKRNFLFGMYMQRFFGDSAHTLINIMEM